MTPSRRPSSDTASGVPPDRATFSTDWVKAAGGLASPIAASRLSTAPLRQVLSPASSPDSRVLAENGTGTAPSGAVVTTSWRSRASTCTERPSGVSSPTEAMAAARASCPASMPGIGWNAAAMRLPNVMVPVLSSSRVSTSPAASTARPEVATTLKRTSRSMPAMPIADSRPPMVVGISVTSRAASTGTDSTVPE